MLDQRRLARAGGIHGWMVETGCDPSGIGSWAGRYAGLRLAEGVEAQGAIQYQAAAQAVKRFEAPLAEDPERRRNADPMRRQLLTI